MDTMTGKELAKAELAKLRALEVQAWMQEQSQLADDYAAAVMAAGGRRGAVLAHWDVICDKKVAVRRELSKPQEAE